MDVERDDSTGPFLGEVRPHYGRWTWPLSWMKPGEFFIVDHARRDPEDLRKYVSVRAAQLNKRFSVAARDPEHPGYCRVSCVEFDAGGEEPEVNVMDFDKVETKMVDWYGVDLGAVLPWSVLPARGKAFVAAAQLSAPPVKRMIVRIDIPDGWAGLVFKSEGFDVYGLPAGTAISNWKLEEPSIDEVMQ